MDFRFEEGKGAEEVAQSSTAGPTDRFKLRVSSLLRHPGRTLGGEK